jgi:type IV secretory pathway VirB4 component
MDLKYQMNESINREELYFLLSQLESGVVKRINLFSDGDAVYLVLTYTNEEVEDEMV